MLVWFRVVTSQPKVDAAPDAIVSSPVWPQCDMGDGGPRLHTAIEQPQHCEQTGVEAGCGWNYLKIRNRDESRNTRKQRIQCLVCVHSNIHPPGEIERFGNALSLLCVSWFQRLFPGLSHGNFQAAPVLASRWVLASISEGFERRRWRLKPPNMGGLLAAALPVV